MAPSGPSDRRLDGEHLSVEATLGPRLGRLALRRQPQGIGVGPREIEYFSAMRSADVNWSGMSHGQSGGNGRPGPLTTFAPRPTRLIASTPHAMATSTAPEEMALVAR